LETSRRNVDDTLVVRDVEHLQEGIGDIVGVPAEVDPERGIENRGVACDLCRNIVRNDSNSLLSVEP